MPHATRRASLCGRSLYQVINRGNGRRAVFCKETDYQAFLKALAHACIEIPMSVLGFCLMPNHFHLAVLPKADGDLSW
jgi:putative transposase